MNGFVPLQNYTTLKRWHFRRRNLWALYPYKITLLSNINVHLTVSEKALYQYKITPLSNTAHFLNTLYRFVSLQNYTTLKRRE